MNVADRAVLDLAKNVQLFDRNNLKRKPIPDEYKVALSECGATDYTATWYAEGVKDITPVVTVCLYDKKENLISRELINLKRDKLCH